MQVPRVGILTPMSQIPEMSDIIITILAARRRRQLPLRFQRVIADTTDAMEEDGVGPSRLWL